MLSLLFRLLLLFGLIFPATILAGTWTTKAPLTFQRDNLAATKLKGAIYAIGGAPAGVSVLSSMEVYDPVADAWTTKASMPAPRYGPAAVGVNGVIYVMGGTSIVNGQGPIYPLDIYDPNTDSWSSTVPGTTTPLADFPTGRWGFDVAVVDGIIYTVGGAVRVPGNIAKTYLTQTKITGATSVAPAVTPAGTTITGLTNWAQYYFIVTAVDANTGAESAASFEVSALLRGPWTAGAGTSAGDGQATISWMEVPGATSYNIYYSTKSGVTTSSPTKVTGIDATPTTASATVTGLANDIAHYFIVTAMTAGGEVAASDEVSATPQATPNASVPSGVAVTSGDGQVTLTWTPVANAASYNIYYGTNTNIYYGAVEAYDPVANTWTTKATMPTPRWGSSVSLVDGLIYAIGGWGGWPELAVVEVYDPVANAWSTTVPVTAATIAAGTAGMPLAPMPTARDDFGFSVVNGIIYAIGGDTNTFNDAAGTPCCTTVVEAYDPVANTWSSLPSMPTIRDDFDAVTVDGMIYAIAGSRDGKFSQLLNLDPAWLAANNGGFSLTTVEAYTPSDIPVPGSVTATIGTGQATLSWNAVSGATSYNIYWSTKPGVSTASGTKITGVTPPYVHTGLPAGTWHYYIVTAVTAAGESLPSDEVSAHVYSFTAQTGAPLNSAIISNSIRIVEAGAGISVSIVGGTYSINGGAYTSAVGAVNLGDTITVQLISSADFFTTTTATLTIDGVDRTFDVTTLAAQTIPDAFTFTAQTDAEPNSVVTSNTITVSGINSVAAISIMGGAYSINGGQYTAAAGTVNNGDTVTVQMTSSDSFGTLSTATLTIGGIDGTFNVTTLTAAPGAPAIGIATPGNTQATVTFTAPTSDGGSPITGYTVTSIPAGGVDSNAGTTALTHTITGLTNGTAYRFTVTATNSVGTGTASAASNSVTPKASQTIGPITFAPAVLAVGGTTTANAVATSGLPITFSTASAACTATGTNGSTITGVTAGACIINANQAGNANYNPAPLREQTLTVGPAPVPAVALNRTALTFAARNLAKPSPAQVVTLTNTGAGVLNIIGIAASGDFARTTTCAATLAAGASCTISVTFTATAMGARAGLVTLTSNAAGSPHRIALTGTGKGTHFDFNGDGKSDLLWRNATTGANQIWFMNGGLKSSTANTTTQASGWTIAGGADFNGDGKTDILWRNAAGQTAVWLMNGSTLLSNTAVAPVMAAPWIVAGTGDFNGDGKADILWRNTTTGANQIWLMNGAVKIGTVNPTAAAIAWTVAGVDDFNADGKADILWRNAATGQDSVWLMNGAAVMAGSGLTSALAAPWTIAGTGDFNGDGRADILWRNPTSGLDSIWFMNGAAAIGAVTTTAAATWSVAGVADFNNDGKADITWRGPLGATSLWLMNGAVRSAGANLTPVMAAPWGVAK